MTGRSDQRGQPSLTIFGRHPVREALSSTGVVVSEIWLRKGTGTKEHRAARHAANQAGIPVSEVPRDALNRITGAPRHDQGIAAKVQLLRIIEVGAFLEHAKGAGAREATSLIALDGVTNSQNVGMVVRSVVGAGLAGLLWPRVGQPWINGLVVRAAAGSIFECPIVLCDTLAEGLVELQASGFTCLGLDVGAGQSIFARPPTHRDVFVLGSETSGLSETVRNLVDERVEIPMAGALESLNVAVAAGLVCFHAGGWLSADR